MRGIVAALLLAITTVLATGCGSSSSGNNTVRVTPDGTGGYVTVGKSGVALSADAGTTTQDTLLSASLITDATAVGAPFAGSDTFITGLQFGSSITPLARPVDFQIPLPSAIPVGSAITVFELGPSGFAPVAVTNSAGSFVPFAINHTGTFVFATQ